MRNDYVVATDAMEFKQQSYDGITDITGQNLIAIKCAYEGILQTFTNFAIALQLVPISVTDLISEYEYLNLSWDEVRVVCYADTAVNLRLYSLKFDTCDEQKDRPRKPPPPPPAPPPVPPGTPLTNLDPPYEDESNPDNVTEPYPDDENTPPPMGERCAVYDVNVTYFPLEPDLYQPDTLTVRLYGEIYEASIKDGGRTGSVVCHGGEGALDAPEPGCLEEPFNCGVITNTNPSYTGGVINFITLVPPE